MKKKYVSQNAFRTQKVAAHYKEQNVKKYPKKSIFLFKNT